MSRVQNLAYRDSFVRSGDIPRDLPSFFTKACHLETFMKILLQSATDGEVRLKEYECVEVKNHKDIGITIKEWQKKGWRLHTYQTAGMGAGPMAYKVNHYLLFERETGS